MKKIGLILMTMMVIMLLASCKGNKEQSSKEVNVETEEMSEILDVIEVFGDVTLKEVYNVVLDFPGVVEEIDVRPGQKLNKGDKILTLDISDYLYQLEAKEVELEIAELELEKLHGETNHENDIMSQKIIKEIKVERNELSRLENELYVKKQELNHNNSNDLKKLENDLKVAKNELEKSEEDLEKKTQLNQLGSISKSELDGCIALVYNNKKRVEDIEISISSTKEKIKQNINTLDYSISQLKNKITGLEIEVGSNNINSQIQLEKRDKLDDELHNMYRKLHKPYIEEGKIFISNMDNGAVYDIGVQTGDYISKGTKIYSIWDLDTIIVEAEVSEDFIKDVKIGSVAEIVPNADYERKYEGKVVHISNVATKKGGEAVITVEIEVDNKDGFLLPNYSVDVKIFK